MIQREYLEDRRNFSWGHVLSDLGWHGAEKVNLGETILDRNADTHDVALYAIGKNGDLNVWTYQQLVALSNRVANFARSVGSQKGRSDSRRAVAPSRNRSNYDRRLEDRGYLCANLHRLWVRSRRRQNAQM